MEGWLYCWYFHCISNQIIKTKFSTSPQNPWFTGVLDFSVKKALLFPGTVTKLWFPKFFLCFLEAFSETRKFSLSRSSSVKMVESGGEERISQVSKTTGYWTIVSVQIISFWLLLDCQCLLFNNQQEHTCSQKTLGYFSCSIEPYIMRNKRN